MARTSKKASNYRGFVYLNVGSNPTGRTKNEPELTGSFCLCFRLFLSEIRYFYLKMLFYLKIVMRGFSRKNEEKHAKTRDFAYQNGHEKWPQNSRRVLFPPAIFVYSLLWFSMYSRSAALIVGATGTAFRYSMISASDLNITLKEIILLFSFIQRFFASLSGILRAPLVVC